MSASIASRTRNIISQHLNTHADEMPDTSRIIGDLGADSLDTVELVMIYETEFNITITDRDAEEMETIAATIQTLELICEQQHPANKGN